MQSYFGEEEIEVQRCDSETYTTVLSLHASIINEHVLCLRCAQHFRKHCLMGICRIVPLNAHAPTSGWLDELNVFTEALERSEPFYFVLEVEVSMTPCIGILHAMTDSKMSGVPDSPLTAKKEVPSHPTNEFSQPSQ